MAVRKPLNAYPFCIDLSAKKWVYDRNFRYTETLANHGYDDKTLRQRLKDKSLQVRYHKDEGPLFISTPLKSHGSDPLVPDVVAWTFDPVQGDLFLDYYSVQKLATFLDINNGHNLISSVSSAVNFIQRHHTPEQYANTAGVYIGCLDPDNAEQKPFVFDLLLRLVTLLNFRSRHYMPVDAFSKTVAFWAYLLMSRFARASHAFLGHAPAWHYKAERLLSKPICSTLAMNYRNAFENEQKHNAFIIALDDLGLDFNDTQGLLIYKGADYNNHLALFDCACGNRLTLTAEQIKDARHCKSLDHIRFLHFFRLLDKTTKHYFHDDPRFAWLELTKQNGIDIGALIGEESMLVPKPKPEAEHKPVKSLHHIDYVWCALNEDPKDLQKAQAS